MNRFENLYLQFRSLQFMIVENLYSAPSRMPARRTLAAQPRSNRIVLRIAKNEAEWPAGILLHVLLLSFGKPRHTTDSHLARLTPLWPLLENPRSATEREEPRILSLNFLLRRCVVTNSGKHLG